MSIEAYKVAVRISLVENVTRGLAMMTRHFKTTDAEARVLEARLKSIGKMAMFGGLLAGAGVVGLRMFAGPIDEAKRYQTLLERFQQFGMGDVALRDAQKFVEAQRIAGTSQRDMMRYFIEAQGVFRESGANGVSQQLAAARMAAPMMAKMVFAARGLDEHGKQVTEASQMDMLRFVEQAGGLSSPARFNQLLNSGFKAIQSSGGNVNFPLYRQFMSYGGTAAMSLTDRSLFADLEPIIGELKSRAGVGLRTASNRLNGVVKLPNQVAHELVSMGIWDGGKIQWNSQGGIKRFTGNPLIDSQLFGTSPVDFYEQKVLPKYNAMHLTAQERYLENAKIFGGTGGQLYSNIDRFLPQIHHSRQAFDRARGVDGAFEAVKGTAAGKEVNLLAREADLKLKIGQLILPMYVRALELTASALQRVTDFATAHPTLMKFAVAGFAVVSALAIVGGGLMLFTAGMRGLMLVLGPLQWLLLAMGPREIGIIGYVARGLMFVGRAFAGLLIGLGPVGWVILGIGAAATLIYLNWNKIKPVLMAIGHWVYTAFANVYNSITGWLSSLINWIKNSSFGKWVSEATSSVGRAVSETFSADSSPYVHPGSHRPAQVHTTINMDGRRVATAVTNHQARAAGRSNIGTTGFDGNRDQYHPAMSAMK